MSSEKYLDHKDLYNEIVISNNAGILTNEALRSIEVLYDRVIVMYKPINLNITTSIKNDLIKNYISWYYNRYYYKVGKRLNKIDKVLNRIG